MKIILKTDVKKVGKKGEIVDVADGYARNFLIARGLAVMQTERSMEILEEQKQKAKELDLENKKKAEELKEKLEKEMFVFWLNAGSEGRVFGSVSTKQIVEELRKKGYQVDKRKFLQSSPIVSLGVTKVQVELYKGVIATLSIQIKGKE